MSVLKTRNRLINFRLTEDEFHSLHQACARQNARSVSDFARAAVMGQVEEPEAGPDLAATVTTMTATVTTMTASVTTIAEQATRIESAIQGLDTRIGQLATLLQPPQPPQ